MYVSQQCKALITVCMYDSNVKLASVNSTVFCQILWLAEAKSPKFHSFSFTNKLSNLQLN